MLTPEGLEVVKCGSHEARVYNAVDSREGASQAQIMVCVCVWWTPSHPAILEASQFPCNGFRLEGVYFVLCTYELLTCPKQPEKTALIRGIAPIEF